MGGINPLEKIAAISEGAFVGGWPHVVGSPVATAAQVQVDATIPHFVLQSSNVIRTPISEIVDEPLKIEKGYVIVPDRPGIGIEINEEVLAKYPYKPYPITGKLHEDGSVAH